MSRQPILFLLSFAALLAGPAWADLDDSFEGGTRADFEAFMAAGVEEIAPEDRETFGKGALALIIERYPLAQGADPFARLAMVQPALEAAGATMTGLSYREILEYGRLLARRSGQTGQPTEQEAETDPKLTEDELVACLQEKVPITFEGVARAEYVSGSSDISAIVENKLDRAISAIRIEFSYRTDGRSVPWAASEASTAISGGIEPGETLEKTIIVGDYAQWEDKPEPLIYQLRVVQVWDADGTSFTYEGFGQEVCTGG
jgi:hypothetical protein